MLIKWHGKLTKDMFIMALNAVLLNETVGVNFLLKEKFVTYGSDFRLPHYSKRFSLEREKIY